MPRIYKSKATNWSSKALQDALSERKAVGTSIRKLEKKFNVPKTTIMRHLKPIPLQQRGRKTVFSKEEEEELRDCIVDLASLGFGLRLVDIGELVESYVKSSNHEQGKKVFNYKKRSGYPGPDWLNSFMRRHNLSLKEATKLCRARYNATKNPFIINNFYDMLEQIVKDLGLENKPHLIWNCDESGLPYDPKRCRIVSKVGQKTLQVCERVEVFSILNI